MCQKQMDSEFNGFKGVVFEIVMQMIKGILIEQEQIARDDQSYAHSWQSVNETINKQRVIGNEILYKQNQNWRVETRGEP